ncbi:PREDICTED: probable DNA-directed RNA polymerases I and III subunit RPAC2 [Polistes dominula]|uniref:DNA-directed RNA polymerase I subunit D n=1 Tax=Polistes dominula TaxID=743375 RepID=A0ABM1JDT3_POLDO|nr:PREDICTED: probable DNA-directed RNA polymerases I and III subunit RPAC2 [Polistes dominula]
MGRLVVLAGDQVHGEQSRTFIFLNEGHTLGNALQNIIAHYPEVTFCGYTVPHPAENKINFRIQTKTGRATDILKRGLQDLEKICDHTLEVFNEAYKQYKSSKNVSSENT